MKDAKGHGSEYRGGTKPRTKAGIAKAKVASKATVQHNKLVHHALIAFAKKNEQEQTAKHAEAMAKMRAATSPVGNLPTQERSYAGNNPAKGYGEGEEHDWRKGNSPAAKALRNEGHGKALKGVGSGRNSGKSTHRGSIPSAHVVIGASGRVANRRATAILRS